METKSDIKILLVDDSEVNLYAMEELLSKDNYIIKTASSGTEALKILLNEHDFSIILMDVQMPGINGIETASMIYEREKLKHIPIIFITGAEYSETLLFKGYKTGGVDYIYKPINPDLLRAKVSVFVELFRKNYLLREQEQRLQRINLELEQRVKDRTEELSTKNDELERINTELKRVNNDLDNFVYTASHDLKAPVSNIEGLLSTLKESIPSEILEQDEMIESVMKMIDQSIIRFKSTLQDLSDIAKIQKSVEEDQEELDLSEIIENIKVDLRDKIKESDAQIILDLQECPQVRFSRKNLYSILLNLISNAIKYRCPEMNPEVRVRSTIFENYALIKVRDNGLGINPAEKEKVFSMFKRLHNHVEGTGVGLYIVKKIIENAGGKIEVESQKGKGSLFKVFLPLVEVEKPEEKKYANQ